MISILFFSILIIVTWIYRSCWCSSFSDGFSVCHQHSRIEESLVALGGGWGQAVGARAGADAFGGGAPGLGAEAQGVAHRVGIEAEAQTHAAAKPVLVIIAGASAVLATGRHWSWLGILCSANACWGEDILEEGIGVEIKVCGWELWEKWGVIWLLLAVVAVVAAHVVEAVAASAKSISIIVVGHWHGTGRFGKVVVIHVWIVGVARVAWVILVPPAALSLAAVACVTVLLLLLLFLDGALLDVVGELCGGHPVGLLAVGLELRAPELCLSKCRRGVDHGGLAGLEVVTRGGAGAWAWGAGGGAAAGRGEGRGQGARQRGHGPGGRGELGAGPACCRLGLWKTEAIEGRRQGVQGEEASADIRVDVLKVDVAVLLAVEDLDGALLAHPVAHLPRVDPHGEVSREVLDDVGDGVAALSGGAVKDGVAGVGDLEASVGGSLEGLVWIPVALELVSQRILELLAKQVDTP